MSDGYAHTKYRYPITNNKREIRNTKFFNFFPSSHKTMNMKQQQQSIL